jgi:hypothetical protein
MGDTLRQRLRVRTGDLVNGVISDANGVWFAAGDGLVPS